MNDYKFKSGTLVEVLEDVRVLESTILGSDLGYILIERGKIGVVSDHWCGARSDDCCFVSFYLVEKIKIEVRIEKNKLRIL